MILKELTTDHYVVVDDSEIKVGDMSLLIVDEFAPMILAHFEPVQEGYIGKKITHSTQPIERFNWMGNSEKGYDTIKPLSLQEVKELIGEVDISQKFKEIDGSCQKGEYEHWLFESGYNQAIEDNKDKKYTEEDIRKAIEMARDIKDNSAHDIFTVEDISGCTEVCTYGWRNRYKDEEIIQSFQPKTEWEVEFDENGKLRLV